MALFTKILILALIAVAVECQGIMGGMGGMGMGGMGYGGGMGMGGMGYGNMMYPGMMYPGMMGFKEGEESSDKRAGSSTPLPTSSQPARNDPRPLRTNDPRPEEITKAFGDLADRIRKDNPGLPDLHQRRNRQVPY